MWLIAVLIIVGALLLVAELILLPGLSVAGICALISYGAAVYIGFDRFGSTGGIIVICVIAAVSLIATFLSLRTKTWQRLSLKNKVEGTSQEVPENKVAVGDHGIATTRLCPVGKVEINGESYEGKSLGDLYVDPRTPVEVVGFENFTVIVKTLNEDK